MLIEVTNEDIRHGRRNSCSNCPVALAISRKLGKQAFLGSHTWRIDGTKHFLPDGVIRFIHDYDLYRPVTPIQFELAD